MISWALSDEVGKYVGVQDEDFEPIASEIKSYLYQDCRFSFERQQLGSNIC